MGLNQLGGNQWHRALANSGRTRAMSQRPVLAGLSEKLAPFVRQMSMSTGRSSAGCGNHSPGGTMFSVAIGETRWPNNPLTNT